MYTALNNKESSHIDGRTVSQAVQRDAATHILKECERNKRPISTSMSGLHGTEAEVT